MFFLIFLFFFSFFFFFFFNDPATTEIYTLSLHVALPISRHIRAPQAGRPLHDTLRLLPRSEEHTSELQSQFHLVCRLLLEKKNKTQKPSSSSGRWAAFCPRDIKRTMV